ncbi:MAG TPA: formimidoylglutamate deiminase [Pyrinomonadaceae bacterium]|nr:formimidoylglutamate deiminase [Pyrinomonadaceae bacterium]
MSTTPEPNDARARLVLWRPDLLYVGRRFRRGAALLSDADGRVRGVLSDGPPSSDEAGLPPGGGFTFDAARGELRDASGVVASVRVVRLAGRALLPGMVNAHSHAFQRVIRGRTEHRASVSDTFWTWREMMYAAAARLTPEDIYDASRMAFLEMAACGITSVGEFHYLHRTAAGDPYEDPNLLAKQVVRAARDTGLRVALLRVAYTRSGFRQPPNARQSRFIEPDAETYLRHVERLRSDLAAADDTRARVDVDGGGAALKGAWVGVAPHSVRAVPLPLLRELCAFAEERRLPVHMHVAEQRAEIEACLAEHGRTPVELLSREGLLGARFTAVHAVHVTPDEAFALGRARANVCACPTTERNLGDGIVPADLLLGHGVPLSLGTDSHTQIDLLEDARELEYHLRLQHQARNVLAPRDDDGATAGGDDERPLGLRIPALAARLFDCATFGGARSIGMIEEEEDAFDEGRGMLAAGRAADFFTVDLNDLSIAGASEDDLLPAVVFSLARTAVRDVAVGGRLILEDGRHADAAEIVARFNALQRKLWG